MYADGSLPDAPDNPGPMRAVVSAASTMNPDAEAKTQQLARQSGMGVDLTRHDPATAQQLAVNADLDRRELELKNPILARQLSDPNFAAIAHDQLDNLSTTEKVFNWVKSVPSTAAGMSDALMVGGKGGKFPTSVWDLPFTPAAQDFGGQAEVGYLQYERGMLGIKAKRGAATSDDLNRIKDINSQIKGIPAQTTPFGAIGSMAGGMAPMVPKSLAVGGVAGLAAGGEALIPGVTAPAAPLAALGGFAVGFNSEMGAEMYETTAGNTYLDLLDKGVDEHRAQWAAGFVGAASTAAMLGGLRAAGEPAGVAAKAAAMRVFNRVAGEQVAEAMVRPTVAKAVQAAVLGWAKNTAIGTGEMATLPVISHLGKDWAQKYSLDQTAADFNSPEFAKEFGDSLVNSAIGMGAFGASSSMIGLHADMARAADADRSSKFFTALSENAAGSEVRKRNPNAYENYVAAQADGSGAQNTYIDGQKMAEVLHQTGVDPMEVEKAVPGFSKQLIEAQATGGDVEIPTAKFATHIAGTDLGNAMTEHLRLDPDAMSASEATEFQSKVQEMQTEAKLNATERLANDAGFALSAKNVEDKVFEQLQATKTMPDDVARTNAQLMGSMVSTLANGEGLSPEEFYAKHESGIQRAGAATLSQDGMADETSDKGAGETSTHPLQGTPPAKGGDILRQSEPENTRGGFDPVTRNIMLGDKANFTTFAHEAGHYYLSVLSELASQDNAQGWIKHDTDTLMKWFGTTHEQWKAWDQELKDTGKINPEQAKFHEQFAYTYEKYLADGKAPTPELQSIFERFSRWIKRAYSNVSDNIGQIYKQQHGVDLPESNNEVRQVMDRMLASDEQIKQAEAERHMEPIFKEKPESMDDNEWTAYQQMGREASDEASSKLGAASIRQMQWLSKAKSLALKEMQAKHDSVRADTREEVAAEVKKDPVRQAAEFLKSGRMTTPDGEEIESEGHKLDKDAVASMFPESALGERPDLSKLRGMTAEGGIHPDLAAEMFGFDNGQHMIRNIVDAKPIEDEIDARTDQRMIERHGDMNDPEAMSQAVDKALHNEARQRFVAVELRHLQGATTPVRFMTKAADAAAERMIAEKPISEINPRDYGVAETRAAKAAEDALKRGDSAGAVKAKQNQLIQHSLARIAADVQEESQKIQKYLGKFVKPKLAMAKAIGADYMDRINEVVAGYALAAREPVGEGREDISSWVRSEYDRTGIMPAVSDDLIASMGKMHWKDMNIGQLRDLGDAVKSLDYIGRRSKVVEIEGKLVDVQDLVGEVRDNMAGVKHTAPVDFRADLLHGKGLTKISAQFLNAKSLVRGMDAALIKMEQLFEWLDAGKDAGLKEAPVDGPMQRIFHMAATAEGKERAMRADSAEAMRELGRKLEGSKINLNDVLDVPELPRDGRGTKWYREELISLALNMGNESNKEKLLQGYMWHEQQANAAISRLLSRPEMEFVQGAWDHIGSYGDGIKELQRRQTGVTPKMVQPSELTTNVGTFKGGYYPVVYDDFQDRNIELKNARSADKLFENNYAMPSTSKGHTIERTGYVGPIHLSLGVIARHLDQVTHDLAWREPVSDMNKVLSDEGLQDEIDQTYGKEYSKQLRPWLQAIANDKVFNTAGDSAWEKFYRGARTNATILGIGFRLSTMEIHGLSALSNSIGEVGAKWFAKGAAQFAGFDRIQATRDFIYERSPEMANRMNTIDRNIHEAIDGINRRENSLVSPNAAVKVVDAARRFGFYGVSMIDMASAMPTWMGAYLKGMAKEADGGLNLSEADAIENGNRAVRNAHGGGGVKDMASVQRSKGITSMLTMFYSFWNHMYNRQRDIGKGINAMAHGQGSVHDMPRLLARSFFYFVVPQMIHAVFKGQQSKDDDGSLEGFTKHLGKEMGLGFVSGVPGLRDLASAYVNGRDYTITPLEQIGKSIVTAADDATHLAEGEPTSKNAITNAAQAAGYTFGIPTAQPAATTKFLWDVIDGDQDPEGLSDWWKGITTGKSIR